MSRLPSQREFVAMMALLFAMIALSIDSMLPALPAIAADLTPLDVNAAQLVVSSFFFGMGFGTFIAGPMSDAFGRKRVIAAFAVIYVAAAILCAVAPSLQMLLLARVIQGIGAAAPRVVGMAMVRDMYKGREMERIVSFVMTIFMVAPALAPLMGQGILLFGSWRAIFMALVVLGVLVNAWVLWRQPETLVAAKRRPLHLGVLWQAAKELARHRIALIATLCQTLTSGCLLATITSQQGIFEETFPRAGTFPLWFGFIAICASGGSFLNSRVVVRLGMRAVIRAAYTVQVGLTLLILGLDASGAMPAVLVFPAHILWSIGVFATMGLTMGNLNALAMEDLGHIAGFAASMITATSTVLSVLIAVPVGLAFNGTQIPLMVGVAVFSALALALILTVKKPPAGIFVQV
jgi:DHA1 family bicyclomycin/chloramphenicol resistance-like MFS transporter